MLPRVSPPTPTRCNPVALGFKPPESVSNLRPTDQISYFNRIECKVRGSAVRAPDLGLTSGKCQCASQGVPSNATRCNPVALGLQSREFVSNLGPRAKFRVLYRIETKVLGSAVRALDLGPASGKLVCSQGCPFQHLLGVTPLSWDLSPENRCQTWDTLAKYRILIV